MEVKFEETGNRFFVTLEPDNIEEAAQLVRIGMNAKDSNTRIQTDVYKTGKIFTNIIVDQRKRSNSTVPKQR